MKAISLWQPWASLIMLGAKRVETRSWRPPEALIGQRVMIHAAKRIDGCVLREPFSIHIADPVRDAPTGALLGSAKIEGAWRIDTLSDAILIASEYHRGEDGSAIDDELAFGDYTVGRWAWGLAEVRRLNEPIPYTGGQRFFNLKPPYLELLLAGHAR
jgi:hypothetical protein